MKGGYDASSSPARENLLAGDHLVQIRADGKSTPKPKRSEAAAYARWQLWVAMGFCFLFMIGEVVGGYLAGSLAIMTE
jgi:hypothetical protein